MNYKHNHFLSSTPPSPHFHHPHTSKQPTTLSSDPYLPPQPCPPTPPNPHPRLPLKSSTISPPTCPTSSSEQTHQNQVRIRAFLPQKQHQIEVLPLPLPLHPPLPSCHKPRGSGFHRGHSPLPLRGRDILFLLLE